MSQPIIINSHDRITCPRCAQQYPLADALTSNLVSAHAAAYQATLDQKTAAITAQLTHELERKQAREYQARLAEMEDKIAASQATEARLRAQMEAATQRAAAEAKCEAEREAAELREMLQAKDAKLEAFRQAELDVRRQKAVLEEQKQDLALELQRRLEAERAAMEAKLFESYALREAELRKKIADAQKVNEDLSRKLEQGSQQLRGEVLELEIESLLQSCHPFDKVEAVRKGAHGADIVQSVNLRSGTCCGRIVWETKRAEKWSSAWVGKLKQDLQQAQGDIAVLVTTVFPAGAPEAIAVYEGVWLVSPALVQGFSEALRTVLIESQRQRAISTTKGEQVAALYDYICSNRFAQHLCAIMENYHEMQRDLEKEKAATLRLWKKREGQMMKAIGQVSEICGELQGISAQGLPHLEQVAGLE